MSISKSQLFTPSAIALAVALPFSTNAFAQQANSQQQADKQDIEVINVWGTQIKASSVFINSEDMITKQADHISDLLRAIPGVDVGGAHSLNQRITIRGMDDKDLKISIDGASQNSYMFHHMGNLQIHADILKSVDIEVGTNSVINGGLGGAVRFETKTAAELLDKNARFGARYQISAGTNSSSNVSATNYGLLGDNIDFLLYHNEVNTKNFEVGGGVIKDENGDKVDGTDGKVKGLEGDVSDTLIKFGWDISPSQRLALSFESYKDKGNYNARPDMGTATDIAMTNAIAESFSAYVPLLWPTEFNRDTLTLSYDAQLGDSSLVKATAFTNTSELIRDESAWGLNDGWEADALLITGEAKNTGVNILVETDIEFAGFNHEIIVGGEWLKYETTNSQQATHPTTMAENQAAGESNTTVTGEKSTTTIVYLQDKIALTDQISLIPGMRYEHVDVQATVIDKTFSEPTLSFAAEYTPIDSVLIKASATQLFRAPELAEVFIGAGSGDNPNESLKAETGLNQELSVAYQSQLLGNDTLSAGFTYFNTNIDNYIYDYNYIDGLGYFKDNIGDLNLNGIEAYLSYQIGQLESQVTFSSVDSKIDAFADYSDLQGARIDREQGDTYSANVKYNIEAVNAFITWETMHVKSMGDGINLDGAPIDNSKASFTVHNVAANWQPKSLPNATIIVGVDNLFDEYYASQSSRTGLSFHPRFKVELPLTDYEPGRNIKMTLAYKF